MHGNGRVTLVAAATAAVALLLQACSGDDPAPPVEVEEVSIVFTTGGGCYDDDDPTGCGDVDVGTVDDPVTRDLIGSAADRLAALPTPENGCGGEYVDGVSVRATITVVAAGDGVDERVVCLSDAPREDPAVTALWELYATTRRDGG